MKIEVLAHDGSPLGVTEKTIWGDSKQVGVGGAELALLTLCAEWVKLGHEVVLYNDPREMNVSSFEQRKIADFEPKMDRDILINFRSPNPMSTLSTVKGKKIWWSTDQYSVGDYAKFSSYMDEIVVISPFHSDHFRSAYGINGVHVIDIPVRVDDYNIDVPKIKNRLIFTSVPDRGLDNLLKAWPMVLMFVKDASLVITSDYRLWGVPHANNEHFRVKWMRTKNVMFHGALPRKAFIKEELAADVFAYPSSYDELFCISCAEAQYAGAYPVTSTTGALRTTNMGIKVEGVSSDRGFSRTFAEEIAKVLSDRDELKMMQQDIRTKARDRFHPDKILKSWDRVFNL